MSQEESACCRSMQGRCGGMEKMGCCRTEVQTDAHPQLASAGPTPDIPSVSMVAFLRFVASKPEVSRALFRSPDEHSPPGLLTARTTVLRI